MNTSRKIRHIQLSERSRRTNERADNRCADFVGITIPFAAIDRVTFRANYVPPLKSTAKRLNRSN
ncbi:hypothetical protein [Pyrinomonas sp.]|uniref:hypothetical protein n=1 Tax=Pyrinomonas sp. TaxID=2080306 RepID=UPI00332C4474